LSIDQKKGSKRFRKILSPKQCNYVPHNIIKFRDNVDITISLDCATKLNSCWNAHIFNNITKTFFFKLYTNTLEYNNAVAHFVRNHSPNCTFCDEARVPENINKTPLHLFFNCRITETFIENMFKRFANDDCFDFLRKENNYKH
jgi:hypothetical protein